MQMPCIWIQIYKALNNVIFSDFFWSMWGPSYLNFKHAYLFLNIIHTGSETCWEFSHELKFLTKIYRNLRQILGLKHICSLLILCFLSTSKLSFLKRRIKSRYEFHKAFRFSTNFKNLIVIFSKKYGPRLWIGVNCQKAADPLLEDTLFSTKKSWRVPGTLLIDHGR